MRYYARCDENNSLICFGVGYGGTEITEEEYRELENRTNLRWAARDAVVSGETEIESVDDDIREDVRRDTVHQFAEQVYAGASINAVPESLQTDVQTTVDALIAERGPIEEQEIDDDEALNIILGGETT